VSFDLSMFGVREGETVAQARERLAEDDPENEPGTPEGAARRKELVAALLEVDPEFDVFESPPDRGRPYVELTSLNDEQPAQFTVDEESFSINVPYWHSGDDARRTLDAVWKVVRVVRDRTGWILYDEQLGKPVDIDAGPEQLVEGYEYGTAAAAAIVAAEGGEGESAEPRPRKRKRFWLF
jgi:hypothetical protein